MVYLLGVGPGDPGLITVKAASVLREADIIFVPQSNFEGRSVAENIIAPYAQKSKISFVVVPMTKDRGLIEKAYARVADIIESYEARGQMVACVTLGDSMFYSTAHHIGARLQARSVPHEYLSGIPSFVEAANRLGLCLAVGRERTLTAPMPESVEETAALAAANDSVVFMKINKRLPVLMEYVKQYQPMVARLVHRAGLHDERIIDLVAAQAMPEGIGYLSLAIIRARAGEQ